MDWEILKKKVNILKEKYEVYKSQNSVNKLELREIILDILSWFEICIKNDNFFNNSGLISGFRYINNKKKHADEIYEYTFITRGSFPSNNIFPSSQLYPSELKITWCQIDTESDNNWVHQWKNYQSNLANENVLKTIDLLLKALKEHYRLK